MHPLASRFSNKLNMFVTRSSDPWGFTVDVMITPWDQLNLIYAFSPQQLLASSALQVCGRGYFSDTHSIKLVQKVVVLTLCADLLFQGLVYHSASQVNGFNRMTVEVQVLSDRDLSDLIIPKLLKTRKSIFLQSIPLHLEGLLCKCKAS